MITRVRFAGIRKVSLERVALPNELPAGEVRLRVQACGICGTEVNQFEGRWPQPVWTPGHECAGAVEASSADTLSSGERVAVVPLVGCGECRYCAEGRQNLCASGGVLGEVRDGAMATYLTVPASLCRRIPETMPFEEATLLEPLSVAVHGLRECGGLEGTTVGVVGAGAVGLMFVQAAKALGAARVICVAKHGFQRDLAGSLGADRVALGSEEAHALTGSSDAAVDCVGGRGEGFARAMKLVRRGGTIVAVGGYRGLAGVDMWGVVRGELTVRGAFCYSVQDGVHDMDTALQLCAEGKVSLGPLVSHRSDLSQAQKAFETAADRAGSGSVRVVLTCGETA